LVTFSLPKYEKSHIISERKSFSRICESEELKISNSQQGEYPEATFKDFDDWDIISNSSIGSRISKITIYADYYLWAIEVTYEDKNGKITTSIHTQDDSYLQEWDKLK